MSRVQKEEGPCERWGAHLEGETTAIGVWGLGGWGTRPEKELGARLRCPLKDLHFPCNCLAGTDTPAFSLQEKAFLQQCGLRAGRPV